MSIDKGNNEDTILFEKESSEISFDMNNRKEKLSETLTYIKKLIEFCTEIDYDSIGDYTNFGKDDKEIEENIDKFISIKGNKFYHYDIIVNESEDNISERLKEIIPDRISRFAFDREGFTGIRYYIFKNKSGYKVDIGFYGWSAGRENDKYFKNISNKYKDNDNVEKIDLKFSEILNYLKINVLMKR